MWTEGSRIRKSLSDVEFLSADMAVAVLPASTNKCHNTSCENEAGYNTSCAIITLVVSPPARLP